MTIAQRALLEAAGCEWLLPGQEVVENGHGRPPDLFGIGFQLPVALNPVGLGIVAVAPECLEHAFGAFDLLQGGGEGFASFGQVGDIADKEAADAPLLEDGAQEQDDGLLIRIPTPGERFAQELMLKEELNYDEIEAIFKEFGKTRPPMPE